MTNPSWMEGEGSLVAIVDYGLGNLFSVAQACMQTGMKGIVTSKAEDILSADAVILPGVGAFGSAMSNLRRLRLIEPILEFIGSDRPFLGICLGMQLLMSESTEFGVNRGLGVIEGDTVRLDGGVSVDQSPVKVPHIGWNRIFAPSTGKSVNPWSGSMLNGVPEAEHFYFVHSYNVRPADQRLILCTTRYGAYEFCSGLRLGNVHAFQFHPERSGPQGLAIYANLATKILGTNAATS